MSNSSFNLSSISKHFGAAISSKLIAPKLGAIALTVLIISSGSWTSKTIGTLSTFAKCFNKSALPSITGIAALGPKLPKPRIADPSLIIATRLLVQV